MCYVHKADTSKFLHTRGRYIIIDLNTRTFKSTVPMKVFPQVFYMCHILQPQNNLLCKSLTKILSPVYERNTIFSVLNNLYTKIHQVKRSCTESVAFFMLYLK